MVRQTCQHPRGYPSQKDHLNSNRVARYSYGALPHFRGISKDPRTPAPGSSLEGPMLDINHGRLALSQPRTLISGISSNYSYNLPFESGESGGIHY